MKGDESTVDWWPMALSLGIVCTVYLVSLATLHPSVFWSPDEGAKFIQMHSRTLDRDLPHRISYGARKFDPFFAFYPAATIYPRPLWPSGVDCHWPSTFPLVALPFFRLFGCWGLYIVPVVCGILSAALAGCLARRIVPGAAAPAVLLAGLCASSLFVAVLFLEHTLAGALGLSALLAAWAAISRSGRRRLGSCVACVAYLAGLLALRDEAVVFLAALACTGVLVLTGGRLRAGLLFGLLLVFVLPVAFAPEFTPQVHVNRASELLQDASRALAGLRDPDLWASLPHHVLLVVVNNPDQFGVPLASEWAMVGMAGLGLCALSHIVLPSLRLPCWMVGACLAATVSGIGLCQPERYRAVHGLLLPMPCLVLAWLPAPAKERGHERAERFLRVLLPVLICVHVVATWLLRRSTGGPEWGLRYALLAYLLAGVLGGVAVTRFCTSNRGWTRLSGTAMAVLLFALSCGYSLRGVFEMQVTKRDLRAFEQILLEEERPIVTDQWWLAAALAPVFIDTPFYTLNPGTDPLAWIEKTGRHATGFLYVSYTSPPETVQTADGSVALMTTRRTVQEMTFSHFLIRDKP